MKIYSQKRNVLDLLANSDSVAIVSHEENSCKEIITLSLAQRKLFAQTLKQEVSPHEYTMRCFYPHHKVYFYTNKGMAYWWICFGCRTSNNEGLTFENVLNLNLSPEGTIAKLFKKFGLTYQL